LGASFNLEWCEKGWIGKIGRVQESKNGIEEFFIWESSEIIHYSSIRISAGDLFFVNFVATWGQVLTKVPGFKLQPSVCQWDAMGGILSDSMNCECGKTCRSTIWVIAIWWIMNLVNNVNQRIIFLVNSWFNESWFCKSSLHQQSQWYHKEMMYLLTHLHIHSFIRFISSGFIHKHLIHAYHSWSYYQNKRKFILNEWRLLNSILRQLDVYDNSGFKT